MAKKKHLLNGKIPQVGIPYQCHYPHRKEKYTWNLQIISLQRRQKALEPPCWKIPANWFILCFPMQPGWPGTAHPWRKKIQTFTNRYVTKHCIHHQPRFFDLLVAKFSRWKAKFSRWKAKFSRWKFINIIYTTYKYLEPKWGPPFWLEKRTLFWRVVGFAPK